MERLKHLKESIMCCVENQMDRLNEVDAKELGEAIDMLKDLEEAMYYCTITKSMLDQEEEMSGRWYYGGPHTKWSDDMSAVPGSHDRMDWDCSIGKSGHSRKKYLESKKTHHDTATQMRELENYMSELSSDILEMIEEATPEERQYLSKKIATLATKVEAVN